MSLPVLPARGAYLLRNALIPVALSDGLAGAPATGFGTEGLARADILVRDGCFQRPDPAAAPAAELPVVDLDHRLLLPRFADVHTHLDKAYTVQHTGFSSDGLGSAVALWTAGQGHRTLEDDIARMERSLATAQAQGTRALRTHLDTRGAPADNPSWQAWAEVSARWSDRLHLQAVALMALFRVAEPDFGARCAALADLGGILGAFIDAGTATPALIDRLLGLATDHGLDLDLHVDENLDPEANGLHLLAETALRRGFSGRITAGHCCALAQMPAARRDALIARVAEAGIDVVSLPATNGFLQDRAPGRTGLLRGLAPVQELAAAGVPVSFASDNVRDAFYPYGAYDMIEALRLGLFMGQLEQDPARWLSAITATPARTMGLPRTGRLLAGGPAEAVLFDARDWADLLSGTALPRLVLHEGRALAPQAAATEPQWESA